MQRSTYFAIGDALGWPNERRSANIAYNKNYISRFKEWKKKSGGRYWSYNETILAGEYSDDTQVMLAVARSLLSGLKWEDYFTNYELPFWKSYERGGGRAMLRAASLWTNNSAPWKSKENEKYYFSGGNGVAMRILPHVILNLRKNNFDIISNEIVEDAILTHGSPRAILGALCYAYAVYYCLRKTDILNYGELVSEVISNIELWGGFPYGLSKEWLTLANEKYDYKVEWETTAANMVQSLKKIDEAIQLGILDLETETLSSLGCFDKKVNGAGDVAAITSIYFASKYANNPVLGIKQAANSFGSDTDTIAAMTGGLLGGLCGLEWIPYEWKTVQDYSCIERIAECLLEENGSLILKGYSSIKKQEEIWIRLPIGKAKYIKKEVVSCGKNGQVLITKYLTALGQSIYTKEYSRIDKKQNNKTETLKINKDKLKEILLEDSQCNISLSILVKILELQQAGNDITKIATEVELSAEAIAKILSIKL